MMTRTAFLAEVARRADLIEDPALAEPGALPGPHAREDAEHLDAVAVEFADQVDRDNAGRRLMPLDYPEAVLVVGSRGPVVVHRDVYAASQWAVHGEAGDVEAVFTGLGLLGWTA